MGGLFSRGFLSSRDCLLSSQLWYFVVGCSDQRALRRGRGLGPGPISLSREKNPGCIGRLPFALPTAVAGISLATIYGPNGWFGLPILAMTGIKVAYTQLGILVALVFVGLPFVVRTLQPVMEDLDLEFEEAAASLGASRLQTIFRVVGPELFPPLVTGFALAFARAVGEYGSVVFIAGNMPMKTEIVPLLIITKLEQYDYRGATAIAVVMLMISFLLLLAINALQRWSNAGRIR